MSLRSIQNYFLALAFTAIALLWGVSLLNGTVKELILSSLRGSFEDGTAFHTRYTGIIVLDFPISLLVAFFYYGTNNHDPAYQLFLIDAYSTLQSAFVWLYVESGRNVKKPSAVANPIIWGIVWQCFGAAISLPLYYYHHVTWLDGQNHAQLETVDLSFAAAIPVGFILGAVLPAVIGMLPFWIPREVQSHQTILAFWQPDPVWVSLIIYVAAAGIKSITTKQSSQSGSGHASLWIKRSYALAAASSALGHVFVKLTVATSSDDSISFWRMYVPTTLTELGQGQTLTDGPWLFLKFDLVIIALSSLSWAYLLTKQVAVGSVTSSTLLSLFLAGFLTVGPGATVSAALYWREGVLQQNRGSAKKSS